MLRGVGGETCDAAGLVVVLEEDGGPAIGRGKEKVLGLFYCAFELWESPVVGCGLKFVRPLADVNDILHYQWLEAVPGSFLAFGHLQIGRPCLVASLSQTRIAVRASCLECWGTRPQSWHRTSPGSHSFPKETLPSLGRCNIVIQQIATRMLDL